jgi:HD-like signal output (HDOD) protein
LSERLSIAATVSSIEDLPTLPAVAQKLLVLLQDPDYTAAEVCTVIESDQALAARILKLVNSPAYGIARDIKSVDRAVVLLGSDALKNVVMCAGVSAAMEAMGGGVELEGFWRHAAFVGAAARLLAERTQLVPPGEAFLAGLVHDIGELALDVVQPERWRRVLDLGARERLANEKRYLGMTHQRAGQILLGAWCLPDDLVAVARDHHLPREILSSDRPVVSLVAMGDLLSRVAGAGVDLPLEERLLARLLAAVDLSVDELGDVLREIDQRLAAQSAFLGVEAPAAVSRAGLRREPPAQVVLLSAGKRRLAWLHQLCCYHGVEVMALRSFLAQPEQADLVVFDHGNLGRVQLQKLAPFLGKSGAAMASCGDGADDLISEILGIRVPRLDLTFTPAELAAVMALRPVRA